MGQPVFSFTITSCHLKALLMLSSLVVCLFFFLCYYNFQEQIPVEGLSGCQWLLPSPFFLCALMSSQLKIN